MTDENQTSCFCHDASNCCDNHDHSLCHSYHQEACGCHHNHHHAEDCNCGHEHHHHGKTITFEGEIHAPIKAVWETLTLNQNIVLWAPFFQINQAHPLGSVSHLQGERESQYTLFDIEEESFLSFEWYQSLISIELQSNAKEETTIQFIMTIEHVEETHLKELQEWLISLQKLAALAQGQEMPNFEQDMDEIYQDIYKMVFGEEAIETEFE